MPTLLASVTWAESWVNFPNTLHINRFRVIPKKTQPEKWRLIVDLSFPMGASVNDGIPSYRCSLRYPSIDLAIQQIFKVGQDAHLSKLDIKDAYQIVLVHPDDWPLLGMHWRRRYYIDTQLPFGLLPSLLQHLQMQYSG